MKRFRDTLCISKARENVGHPRAIFTGGTHPSLLTRLWLILPIKGTSLKNYLMFPLGVWDYFFFFSFSAFLNLSE